MADVRGPRMHLGRDHAIAGATGALPAHVWHEGRFGSEPVLGSYPDE
jgi:hypothetical protein